MANVAIYIEKVGFHFDLMLPVTTYRKLGGFLAPGPSGIKDIKMCKFFCCDQGKTGECSPPRS